MSNDPVKVPEQRVLYRQVVQVDLDYDIDRFSLVVKSISQDALTLVQLRFSSPRVASMHSMTAPWICCIRLDIG